MKRRLLQTLRVLLCALAVLFCALGFLSAKMMFGEIEAARFVRLVELLSTEEERVRVHDQRHNTTRSRTRYTGLFRFVFIDPTEQGRGEGAAQTIELDASEVSSLRGFVGTSRLAGFDGKGWYVVSSQVAGSAVPLVIASFMFFFTSGLHNRDGELLYKSPDGNEYGARSWIVWTVGGAGVLVSIALGIWAGASGHKTGSMSAASYGFMGVSALLVPFIGAHLLAVVMRKVL